MSVLVILSAAILHSGAGVVSLAEAEQALVEGRFEVVRDRAAAALAVELPVGERVRAHELLGIAEAAFGREAEALLSFRQLLGHAPDHALPPHSSPKLLALFQRARALGALGPPTALPPVTLSAGPPGFVAAALAADAAAGKRERSRPVLEQWWFWGAVGIGAGLATWQLTRPELARGSLGTGELR